MGRPFKTEQAQNVKVYRALRAHSYSDTAHIFTSVMSCKFPRDSSVAVPHIQSPIPKGRGSEKRPYDEIA